MVVCSFPWPFLPRLDFGPVAVLPFRLLPAAPVLASGGFCDEPEPAFAVAVARRVEDLVPAMVKMNSKMVMFTGSNLGGLMH